jgi:hypothetical protein
MALLRMAIVTAWIRKPVPAHLSPMVPTATSAEGELTTTIAALDSALFTA